MPHVRLLLATTPPILCDLVKVLAAETSGLEVVGHVGLEEDLFMAVEQRQADVVMVGTDASGAGVLGQLFRTHPRLRLLTVAEGGRVCYVDRLQPHRTIVRDVSPGELIDAVLGKGRFT